jgi:NAD(P)-dependent dehydrogenase (short-subunit alcohol dehydrogenase family)
MDLELTDKVAVVTGAGKGIGFATVQTLVAEGAHVVAASRSVDTLEGIDRVTAVALDLGDPAAPAQLVQRAIDEHGRVDVLVNNVGALKVRTEGFLATTDADFAWAMNINFYHPDSGVIDYGAAKAALVNFTKAIAQEFGPKGIRINSVSPGPVATDLWLGDDGVAAQVGQAGGVDAATAREQIVAGMGGFPTGRFTQPEEVATLIAMLASARTGNVTGSNYIIDGGLIKTT